MSHRGNSIWNERTAAAALMAGSVITMVGLGLAVGLEAYIGGGVIAFFGGALVAAALMVYRL